MKNPILFFLLFFYTISMAQENEKPAFFSAPKLGLYGGIISSDGKDIQGAYYFEGATYLYRNLICKLSMGYTKIYSLESYNVKTFEHYNIENIEGYKAFSYNVLKTEYQSIPFSLGFQYEYPIEKYRPYLELGTGYKWIDPLTYESTRHETGDYPTYDRLPAEYKNKDVLPVSSWHFMLGIGTKYEFLSGHFLDLRYNYQFDSQLPNTHQVLLGIIL